MSSSGFASLAISGALRVLSWTWRTEAAGSEHVRACRQRKEPFVWALWHGRMLLPIWLHRGEGVATMASKSKDGEIIARWLARNGYRPVRGSTSKGGAAALLALIDAMESGAPAALTIDGPKGPPRTVTPGILTLVRKTKAWILPVSASASRPKFLKSWDRYLVPMSFSRNLVIYGEPFQIGQQSDEQASARIKASLDELTAEADRRLGVQAPPPW
jgi:lysophospholipid acyltransferase (LPLAT)-like uncharacterized protein